jgi:hypothetical protein
MGNLEKKNTKNTKTFLLCEASKERKIRERRRKSDGLQQQSQLQ